MMSKREDAAVWPNHVSRMAGQMKDSIRILNGLWCEMGFTQDRMSKRMDLVEMHCRDMFKTMVEEEEEYKSRLVMEVKKFTEEVKNLAFEMKEEVSLDENWESLVVAESALKTKLEGLKKIKEDRLRIYWQLKTKDKSTSFRLGVDEHPALEGNIPTTEYLEDLKSSLALKEAELGRIEKAYCEKREIILTLMADLEIKPSTPLERNIAAEDISSIRLTKDFLNAVQCHHQELVQQLQERKELAIQLRETLSLLWDRLCVSPAVREAFHDVHPGHGLGSINALRKEIKRCEELKRQNIKQFVEKLRTEIRDLWEKCLLGGDEELAFPSINSTNYTEELLELHELEVIRLKKEAEESRNVLEYLERWNRLFWKQVDLDDRVDDPERLFGNRGGQLLKEEKERRAIQKELPKVEAILMKHYKIWCEARGRTFVYEGMELSQYIQTRWNNYHDQKEMEKMERKRAKEMLLDKEAKLGTQISGGKRKCIPTPGKSPCPSSAKINRLDPASNTRLKLVPTNDNKKTPLKHASRRLLEKPLDADGENLQVAPIIVIEENVNHSIASSIATYADFTHHLEILSKDINCRSSTLPEPTISERRPTPLRPFNGPMLVPIVSPSKQTAGSSKKTPMTKLKTPMKETAKTPPRVACRTPGTPLRTPQLLNNRNLRSVSKTRLGTPKLTTPRSKVPFLV